MGNPLAINHLLCTEFGNNSGGISFVDLTITILEPAPELIPLQSSYVVQRGDTLSDIIIGNFGGNVALWSISPALPDGLVFSNGKISGTPTVNMSLVHYTIREKILEVMMNLNLPSKFLSQPQIYRLKII